MGVEQFVKVLILSDHDDALIPYISPASNNLAGTIKPDNVTTFVDDNGVLSARSSLTGTVGSASNPVYLDDGIIKACDMATIIHKPSTSTGIGNTTTPVYIQESGVPATINALKADMSNLAVEQKLRYLNQSQAWVPSFATAHSWGSCRVGTYTFRYNPWSSTSPNSPHMVLVACRWYRKSDGNWGRLYVFPGDYPYKSAAVSGDAPICIGGGAARQSQNWIWVPLGVGCNTIEYQVAKYGATNLGIWILGYRTLGLNED